MSGSQGMRIQSAFEQRSARFRDSTTGGIQTLSAMDLFLLVNVAQIGAAALLAHYPPDEQAGLEASAQLASKIEHLTARMSGLRPGATADGVGIHLAVDVSVMIAGRYTRFDVIHDEPEEEDGGADSP